MLFISYQKDQNKKLKEIINDESRSQSRVNLKNLQFFSNLALTNTRCKAI